MKRCEVEECGTIVNDKGIRARVLRGKHFCSPACAAYWLATQGIRVVSDNDKPKLPIVYIKIGG